MNKLIRGKLGYGFSRFMGAKVENYAENCADATKLLLFFGKVAIGFYICTLKKAGLRGPAKFWSVRLGVRTPGFHPGNRGSIPLRTTIYLFSSLFAPSCPSGQDLVSKTRSVRLGVRTPGFHPGNRGSIPLRTIFFSFPLSLDSCEKQVIFFSTFFSKIRHH